MVNRIALLILFAVWVLLNGCTSLGEVPVGSSALNEDNELQAGGDSGALEQGRKGEGRKVLLDHDDYTVMNEDGYIDIRRAGETYDIRMRFRAGGKNVVFNMALPKNNEGKDEAEKVEAPAPKEEKEDKPKLQAPREKPETTTEAMKEKNVDEEKKASEETEESSDKRKQEEFTRSYNKSSKHLLQAQRFFYNKEYGRALSETDDALYFTPESALVYALRGSIFFKLGDYEKAKSSWEKALVIDPTSVQVKESLRNLRR